MVSVEVRGHKYVNPGPYPEDRRPTNTVRFTATQINAIRSATNQVRAGCTTSENNTIIFNKLMLKLIFIITVKIYTKIKITDDK